MFTGIIEELGEISSIRHNGGGITLGVKANKVFDDLKIDDSVAINGVCQTVISINKNIFTVEAVEETLSKTTFKDLKVGGKVNLERAVRPIDRLGGHLVMGHVDQTGFVQNIENRTMSRIIWIKFSRDFSKYLIDSGSITVDGVSLTTAKVESDKFMLSVIPHTLEISTIGSLKAGDKVNLEFDAIGKYIEKLLKYSDKVPNPLEALISQPYF